MAPKLERRLLIRTKVLNYRTVVTREDEDGAIMPGVRSFGGVYVLFISATFNNSDRWLAL